MPLLLCGEGILPLLLIEGGTPSRRKAETASPRGDPGQHLGRLAQEPTGFDVVTEGVAVGLRGPGVVEEVLQVGLLGVENVPLEDADQVAQARGEGIPSASLRACLPLLLVFIIEGGTPSRRKAGTASPRKTRSRFV